MADTPLEGGKRSAWMSHVKKTMKANKGKSLMQVLKMAKKTYKKGMKGGSTLAPLPLGGDAGGAPAGAAIVGGRRRRGSRKTRKGTRGSRKH
jgi:hypothetical protein